MGSEDVLSYDTLVFSTNKTDRHYITEILLKVALNTITSGRQNLLAHPLFIYIYCRTCSYPEHIRNTAHCTLNNIIINQLIKP
jgi:hypothetical protein